MTTSLPEYLNVRTIYNRGKITIPQGITDISTVQIVLQDCYFFHNSAASESVAIFASELMKRNAEGFLGTFSVMFRIQTSANEESEQTGHTIEYSLMVVSKRKKLIPIGKEISLEDLQNIAQRNLEILSPTNEVATLRTQMLMESLDTLISCTVVPDNIQSIVDDIVVQTCADQMSNDLLDQWSCLVENLSKGVSEYLSINQPPDVEVTVYWQVYESVVELPILYEVITLHHSSTKRNWYGRKKTRPTHYNQRGYRIDEIEHVRTSLAQGIEHLKEEEYDLITVNQVQQALITNGEQIKPVYPLGAATIALMIFFDL